MARAGTYQIVRGRLRDEVGPAVPSSVDAWADEVHTHRSPGGVQVVALRRELPEARSRPALHLTLFLLALGSAVIAGGFLSGVDPLSTKFSQIGGTWLPVPTDLRLADLGPGLPFAITFIGILLGHELGHYFAARRHRIPVSLPYFIPFPPYFSLVGTLGAFIRLKGPIVRRSQLFDVGVAGPLISFAMSIPVVILGLRMSDVVNTSDAAVYPFLIRFLGEPMRIGSNAVMHVLTALTLPGFEAGQTIALHPVAFAGWLGIFVTALNLLPLGQLDGGHILYAIAGRRQRALGLAFVALLVPLGFLWWGWWLWGAIAVLVSRGGVAHPPVLLDEVPVGSGRRLLGWASMIAFLLSFSPAPLNL